MCRYVAVPAWVHILRLAQHSSVARVHVPRVAKPADVFLSPLAARGAARALLRHGELHRGWWRCANEKHQRLYGREGRAEPEDALVHADVVPAERLGHVFACLPAWLPVADRLPISDPHFLWGSLTYPRLT